MNSLYRFLLVAMLAALAPGIPPVFADPNVRIDSLSSVLPFTQVGNLILIQARADNDTGYFVLDTGTRGLVLNINYFQHYASFQLAHGGGVTGSVGLVSRTIVNSLHFGPVHYSHLEADLIDLGHIESNRGVKILGLLGMRLFARFEMIFDYGTHLIYLHQTGSKEPAGYHDPQLADTAAYQTIPIRIEDGQIIVHVYLRGKRLKFIIDSGAETNILDSRLPKKVFLSVVITRRVVLNGAGPGKIDALYGNIKGLRIGSIDIGSLPVLITDLENMCDAYNNCLNGMLGFDFLSRHKIGFDFSHRKMYIWK